MANYKYIKLLLIAASSTLASCASNRELIGEPAIADGAEGRTIALFSEPRYTARCFSVIEPEPNQFITIDLAAVNDRRIIKSLEDCAAASERSRAAMGSYISNMTRVASGMTPTDRFEFSPKHWPVEFHFNNKIYHIFQGKVLSVE